MDMIEKVIGSEYKFKGRIINTRVDDVELPDGSLGKREIIEHSGGVGVIALTADNKICLVEQYRHPYKEVIYEIPAGKKEAGEQPLECGKRELSEEAGLTAANWQSLGMVYPTPGYCEEIIYLFLATDISEGTAHPDEGELINSKLVSLDAAVDMVMSGKICDAKTQIAILKTATIVKGERV